MVNTKPDIHICGPTSVFHFDPHPYGKWEKGFGASDSAKVRDPDADVQPIECRHPDGMG